MIRLSYESFLRYDKTLDSFMLESMNERFFERILDIYCKIYQFCYHGNKKRNE